MISFFLQVDFAYLFRLYFTHIYHVLRFYWFYLIWSFSLWATLFLGRKSSWHNFNVLYHLLEHRLNLPSFANSFVTYCEYMKSYMWTVVWLRHEYEYFCLSSVHYFRDRFHILFSFLFFFFFSRFGSQFMWLLINCRLGLLLAPSFGALANTSKLVIKGYVTRYWKKMAEI